MIETRAFHRAGELFDYPLHAVDGELGRFKEFFFDDRWWKVRYFVVDTGRWLPGRLVLLSPETIADIDREAGRIDVQLTKSQIERAPSIAEHLPPSRRFEAELNAFYSWTPYWSPVAAGLPAEATPQTLARAAARESELQSSGDVTGFSIGARDGDIGEVEDFILDETDWSVRYLVVDTAVWLPDRRVLLEPPWVEEVRWPERRILVPLSRDEIKGAPDYSARRPITQEYVDRVRGYYRRKL